MFRLFESIRLVNGIPMNLELHNERCNRSRFDLFAEKAPIDLADFVKVSAEYAKRTVKCRIDYDIKVRSVKYEFYVPRRIETLQLVDGDGIDYVYKYSDRSAIQRLKSGSSADDILIVKNGRITDTSFSNVAFFDGISWYTPSEPLLRGTMREKLLRDGLIACRDIRVADLNSYQEIRLINAMIGLDESPVIHIADILA